MQAASPQAHAVPPSLGGARLPSAAPQPRSAGDRGGILRSNNSDLFTARYQAGKTLNFQVCLSWGLAKQNSFSMQGWGFSQAGRITAPARTLSFSPARVPHSPRVYACFSSGNSNFTLKILLVLPKARADPHFRRQCLKQNLFPTPQPHQKILILN